MSYRLAEMTWPGVADAVRSGATTVILPLGSTEQHGPHLPLGTDTIRACTLADRLAQRLPGSLVAPALPFGCSDEHAGFPGLFSLEAETLARVIVDCAVRLVAWGVCRLVLLSAHGGNGRALDLATKLLSHEAPDLRVWVAGNLESVSDAVLEAALRDGISPEALGLHAGEGETSEMLYLSPDLVRLDRATPGFTGDMARILPDLRERGLLAVTPSGVLGDPAHAEAARGARYLDALAAEISAALHPDADGD